MQTVAYVIALMFIGSHFAHLQKIHLLHLADLQNRQNQKLCEDPDVGGEGRGGG